jgi:hypothetical protein
LWRPAGRKWVLTAFRPIEKSLYRILKSGIVWHPDGIY